MGYRDDMEAARQRVAMLERELEKTLPGGTRLPIEVEVVELRRRLARAEEELTAEAKRRELAEKGLQELAVARDRIRSLEESLEMIQAELRRRRREHEALWRKAALAEVRGREADGLRSALREASTNAEREARRADVAEVALIRTQMRLSVERARPRVANPWPLDAVRARPDALTNTYCRSALGAALADELDAEATERAAERLADDLARLALLIADLIWNPPPESAGEVGVLLDLLREGGHPLLEHDSVRLGPLPVDGPGLRIAIAPLALQVAWTRPDGSSVLVTIADDAPLRRAFRD